MTQSVTNTFLETIGVRNQFSVASEYTSSACIQKMVADGDVEAYARPQSSDAASLVKHATQMSDVGLDAIFSDPWYTSSW